MGNPQAAAFVTELESKVHKIKEGFTKFVHSITGKLNGNDGEQDAHDDAGDDREMQVDAAASEADVPRQQSAAGAEAWTEPPDQGAERGHGKPDHDENPSQTLHGVNRVPATPQAQPPMLLRRGRALGALESTQDLSSS